MEYARRGYVVMSIDMYGHGNSDVLYTPEIAPTSVGMYDAVKLIAALPYVDKTKIGVTGHSNGAMAANFAVDLDNKVAKPLIAAVLLVANNATYTDAAAITRTTTNTAGAMWVSLPRSLTNSSSASSRRMARCPLLRISSTSRLPNRS